MPLLQLQNLKSAVASMLFRGDAGLSETLYFWMMFSASIACVIFAIYDFSIGKTLVAFVLLLVALIVAFSIYLLYQKIVPSMLIYQISTVVFLVLFSLLVSKSDGHIERLFWSFTFPIATTFVIGTRWGVIWSSVFLCITMVQLLFVLESAHPQRFLFAYVMVYGVIMIITSWIEFYKNRYYQEIKSQHTKLEQEIEKKKRLEEKLILMSRVDSLSNLLNQQYFWDLVEQKIRIAIDAQHSVCMAIIDIDNFKTINDNHGHPKGDEVIKRVSQEIREHVEEEHLAGRIGGDEFGILFIEQDSHKAYEVVDKLREKIASLCLGLSKEQEITVSIGLAQLESDVNTVSQLYKKADMALYEAKHKGRNQVIKQAEQSLAH